MSGAKPVDVIARRATARVLRRFASGRMSGSEFRIWGDALVSASQDPAIPACICDVEFAFEDWKPGVKISDEGHQWLAMWVLFLLVNKEEFNPAAKISCVPLGLLAGSAAIGGFSFGLVGALVGLVAGMGYFGLVNPRRDPAWEFYPFSSPESFERAKLTPSPFAASA